MYHICSGTTEQAGHGKLVQANWDLAVSEAVGMEGGVEVLLKAAWDCKICATVVVACKRAWFPPPAGAMVSGTWEASTHMKLLSEGMGNQVAGSREHLVLLLAGDNVPHLQQMHSHQGTVLSGDGSYGQRQEDNVIYSG